MTQTTTPTDHTPAQNQTPSPAGHEQPFQAVYHPYDQERQAQLIEVLNTFPRRTERGALAGEALLEYLGWKQQERTIISYWGPSPKELASFLAGTESLLLDQTFKYEDGRELNGGIYLSFFGNHLSFSSHM